jgi:hypothetical protein
VISAQEMCHLTSDDASARKEKTQNPTSSLLREASKETRHSKDNRQVDNCFLKSVSSPLVVVVWRDDCSHC